MNTNTAVLDRPETQERETPPPRQPPSITHVLCKCSKEVALCGQRIGRIIPRGVAIPKPDVCVVCVQMESEPCPRCGHVNRPPAA